MDMYKLKFTRLQNEIFRLLCMNVGESMNKREISMILDVSPTAISKSLPLLQKEDLISFRKEKNVNVIWVDFNRDSQKAIDFKRVENLRMVYESGLVNFLEEKFPGSVIILFGSYSYGEDIISSDIDIAIIGRKEKQVDLEKFEKFFKKEIRINFYDGFNKIHKNLRSNIFNGVVLLGRIGL